MQWRLLLNWNLFFICAMYFAVGYGLYFYLTWLPTYLREARAFSAASAGLLAGLVLFTVQSQACSRILDGQVGEEVWTQNRPMFRRGDRPSVKRPLLAGAALTANPWPRPC
jgi:hypothetical protein